MARIPDQVIERLKAEVSVERLAEARGVVLKRHGADLIGCCPFHEDRTPSLVITPSKNLWHCLGACQAGGTVIDWVMRAEGVSFRHAAELLQNDYYPRGVGPSAAASSSSAAPAKRSTVRKLPTNLEREASDAKLLVQVIEYYHQTLLQSPEALDYLVKRGLSSQEAIETFKLGFANRTLGYRLPDSNRVEGAALRGQLQRLGLVRESGHEHFNGSLVIPIIDAPNGEVTEVYGRKITERLRRRHAAASVSAGAASWRVERNCVERCCARLDAGGHPVRSADRCAHLLVCGLPQRHRELWRRGLHRGSPGARSSSVAPSAC